MLTHVNSMHCNIKYNCKYASFSVYNLRIPVPAMIFIKPDYSASMLLN